MVGDSAPSCEVDGEAGVGPRNIEADVRMSGEKHPGSIDDILIC
jgi:hypothetical protein